MSGGITQRRVDRPAMSTAAGAFPENLDKKAQVKPKTK
jgi:hypothetical protein